jgi:hypothetical protein
MDEFDTSPPLIPSRALKPYASLLMMQCPDNQSREAFKLLRKKIINASCTARIGSVTVSGSGLVGIEQYLASNNSPTIRIDEADAIICRAERPPRWAQPNSEFIDTVNSLSLILRRQNLFAVHCDQSIRNVIVRWLENDSQDILSLVSQDLLQGAFLKGEAKVLWLRGAHAPRSTRPDSKQLSGRHVDEALNPLDDNSFAMTSARAALPVDPSRTMLLGSVGTTPRKATIWNRATRSFDEFMQLVSEVMTVIEETSAAGGGVDRPYPILAAYTKDLSRVSGAYDVAVLPLEDVSTDSDIDLDLMAASETLQRAVMIVHPIATSADFTMDVGLDGAIGGSVLGKASLSATGVHFNFGFSGAPSNIDVVRAVLDALEFADDLITVYYDSGHSISGGGILAPSVRPEPFRNWDFCDFSGYDITVEKPTFAKSPQAIHAGIGEQGDRSLFAWVARSYSEGYLICDDGPGEVSDFLHLAHDCTLSYIHVKSASTRSASRGVAVGAYEVLASQAVKNLTALTIDTLKERLISPIISDPACWVDGQRVAGRHEFLDAIEYHGPQDDKRVVIIQPHVSKTLYDLLKGTVLTADAKRNQSRLQLLETLLNGARGSAMCVGGDLIAVGSLV